MSHLFITNISPSDSVGLAHRFFCLFVIVFCVCVCTRARIHRCKNVKAFNLSNFICVGLVKTNSITTRGIGGTLYLNQHDFQWPIYFMGHLKNNRFQSKLCVFLLHLWQSCLTCTAI